MNADDILVVLNGLSRDKLFLHVDVLFKNCNTVSAVVQYLVTSRANEDVCPQGLLGMPRVVECLKWWQLVQMSLIRA